MDDKTDKLSKQNQQQKNDIYNYNLDHVYCSDNSNYRNAAGINSGSSGGDLKALRKENKQLQAMLLLHLDLIQEQSNQLIAKDKQLLQLREENEQFRLQCERNERRSKGGTGSGSGKTPNANSPTIDTYFSVENSAVHNRLDDKSKKNTQTATKQLINFAHTADDKVVSGSGATNKERNKNNNDINNRSTPITIGFNKERLNAAPTIKYRAASDANNASNVIGSNNGKLISKIILQRKQSDTGEKIFVKAKNVTVDNGKSIEDVSQAVKGPTSIASSDSSEKSLKVAIKTEVIDLGELEPITRTNNSRNGQEQRNRSDGTTEPSYPKVSIKMETDFDERSAQRPVPTTTPPPPPPPPESIKIVLSSPKIILNPVKSEAHGKRIKYYVKSTSEKTPSSSNPPLLSSVSTPAVATVTESTSSSSNGTVAPSVFTRRHSTRQNYLSTAKAYMTREWQLDEIEMEVNQLITDEPCKDASENLEIPKWKTWEFSNTRDPNLPHHRDIEDISEDAYVRRHAKGMMDERKRKKWDVQRIREQRTIERLKRRHCKDELSQQTNDNEIVSFFPPAESLKAIHITDDLPVSAFGELIPALPTNEFSLPWHRSSNSNVITSDTATPSTSAHGGASAQAANVQQIKVIGENTSNASSLIFLSKRRAGRAKQILPTTLSYKNIM